MIALSKIFQFFLLPLAFLWEAFYRVRRFFYTYGYFKQNIFQVPIVSIGNLTFGGTGKTPFTLWLSEFYARHDLKIMILMRGYKGKLEKSSGILRGGRKLGYNPFDYGDEPLLLARRLEQASIVVGRNRSDNLRYYFANEKPDVVLLDDGHQHLKLYRDVNIVLFDALMPIDRYKVAPLGYMREGFSALKAADLVVIGRADQALREDIDELKILVRKYSPPGTVFAEIGYRPTGVFNARTSKKEDIQTLQGRKVVCLAGIASPVSFYALVESLGADLIERHTFPDHHYFTGQEVQEIIDHAKERDALVLTTEKDMVKLRRVSDDEAIHYLEINVIFLDGAKETEALLLKAAKK